MFISISHSFRGLLLCVALLFSTSLVAADYFWVGGSGNWSDISHWATTSGGTTTHSQAPGADDDVFFDANSFTAAGQMVTFNTDIIFCRNLDWTGVTNNPMLVGPASTTLNVFGSLTLDPGMTWEFNGQTVFSGSTDNTIDYANYPAGATITFSGTGSWTLAGTLSCDSTLAFNEGTFNTADEAVICGYLRSEGSASRTLNLGNTEFIVQNSTYLPYPMAPSYLQFPSLVMNANNLTLNAGTSRIDLRGDRVDLLLDGTGNLSFNHVVLRAPMGDSRILPNARYSGSGMEPTVTYNELELFHRTELGGNTMIGNLILYPGQRYSFESGSTFTLDELTAVGDCEASISLAATQAGSQANFVSTNDITADFVSLRSLAASGGGNFSVTNAEDRGNNTGWTFMTKPTEAFFWIGGTGNWNDPAHWSATSGGGSNGCVPSGTDDVFFDANSFTGAGQTVTVNVENASCRNMSWVGATGNPNFSGPEEHQVRVTGSLTFIAAMTHDFAGDYLFASQATDNQITSAGQPFNHIVTFDAGGEWGLADDFYVYEETKLQAGTLRTNDHAFNTQFFRSQTTEPRGLFLGNSYVTIESRQMQFFYTEFWLNSDNLDFDAGTSIIEFIGGFSARSTVEGNQSLTFNVIIFSNPLGQLSNYTDQFTGNLAINIDSVIYRNSGEFGGNHDINYCFLRPGRTFNFQPSATQIFQELVASGSCDEGHTILQSFTTDERSTIALPPNQTFERLLLRDMIVGAGAPATANNSIDAEGNMGWTINSDVSRTLFWVDGSGDWFDTAHWSLSSGGPGGECIPSAIDDVIFDENSVVAFDLFVSNDSDRSAVCRNINWTAGLTDIVNINIRTLRLFGNFTNEASNLRYNTSPTILSGAGDHTITSGGAFMGYINASHTGSYTFTDNVMGFEIGHFTGAIRFAGARADFQRYVSISTNSSKSLDLGNVHLELTGPSSGFTEPLSIYGNSNITVSPGTSLLEFTDPTASIRVDYPATLHNVLFANPAGAARIFSDDQQVDALTANSVTFNGSGRLDLSLTTDTLICAPGKSYVFASNKTQTITDYWQIIGNNCTPVSLTSSIPGSAATASMPATGEILADFIQMRDITGVGGAAFLAGSRSTNINNSNQNWVFETAPEFLEVGFLGEDRALCTGEGITLDAFNFSPGETYRWQDNSTDTTFTTNQSGIYFVEVTFQTSCVIRDTIEVLDALAFSVDLPDNPVICAGDTLTLDADAGINSADYRWQDGTEETSLEVFASGEYFVVVDLGGCLESDTTTLTVTELPTVDLGEDQVACAGEDFTLTADLMAESFRWQDNSMGLTFSGDQAGTYWVEAVNGSCPVRDSVMVTYVDPGLVSLGRDTAVCEADQITLDAGVTGFTYRWQDGSDQQTFTATDEGRYFVEISLSGCTAADTIEVDFVQDLFPEEIMLDFPFCEGTSLELPVGDNPNFSNFRWSDGQAGQLFVTSTPGAYEVEYDYLQSPNFNVCPVTVPFVVSEVPLPIVELGEDILACTGDPVTLTIPQAGVWQDGTVTANYAVDTPGRYRVEAANGPCVAADSVEVDFLPLPTFSLGEDQSTCEGEDLTVVVPSGLGTPSWDDGLVDQQRTFVTSGIRWVDIEDANGCVGRDSVELTFTPIPTLELGQDTVACDDLPFRIVPTISGGELSWPDGSNTAEYSVVGPAPMTVVASLTDNACAITDTITVSFRECINYSAYLPTAFSPNFDGVNDDFTALFDPRVEILEFRMQVFSRWGDQLFLTEDPTQSWDGTARGQALPIGPYLYSIEVTYRDDRGVGNDLITGDIMLTR